MKYKKDIIRYTGIFIIVLAFLFLILILSSCIPKSYIEENIKESVTLFKEKRPIEQLVKRREYTYLYYYTDSILLNIIYNIDSDNPIESTMWANYYENTPTKLNGDFVEAVEKDKQPNQQYLRYWHGSMAILRPLFTILNIEQIYTLNGLILLILEIVLFILLLKKDEKLSFLYVISMIMIAFWIVPLCLEHTWTFYIMIIASIIAICIEKNGDRQLNILFMISGMLTCYLDFLTTEIITVFIPMIFILIIRNKENRISNFKDGLKFIIKISIFWSVGYFGMWIAKWILASAILKINAFDYVINNAIKRINSLQIADTLKEMYIGAIFKNWHTLYPINIIKNKKILWLIPMISAVIIGIFTDWKNIKRKWFSRLLLIISVMPYLRYLILANHSYGHYIFTFRMQIITIISLGWAVLENLNYALIFKEIKINKKWRKDG